jgi:hypothetical protein
VECRPSRGKLAGALIMALAFCFVAVSGLGSPWYFPWLPNTFDTYPYLLRAALMPPGSLSPTVPHALVSAISAGFLALLGGCLAFGVVTRRCRAGALTQRTWPAPLALFGVFAAAYLPLLLLKALIPGSFPLFDRYLLPVLPGITIGLLLQFHRWTQRERLPLIAWLILAVFSFYGVAQTHDYFAQLRARLTLTGYLEGQGIPRQRIMAGFDYDSWTQITVAGCYNDPRVEKPKVIFVPPPETLGFRTLYQLWRYTPVVRPDYVVALSPHPELYHTDVQPTPFACWLPPFERQILLQVRDPKLAEIVHKSSPSTSPQ